MPSNERSLSPKDEALRALLLEVMYALQSCHEHVGLDQLSDIGARFSTWEREAEYERMERSDA